MSSTPETCIRCGAAFECGAAPSAERCWCAELPPIMPVTDEGCLCRKCLEAEVARRLAAVGLCATCRHARALRSKGGADIYLCGLAGEDPRFAKYPRLPMAACPGHAVKAG